MQAVCTELERNFTKCNEDLDAIAKKLDEDFESSNAYKRVREPPRSRSRCDEKVVLAKGV
jgi:hypothetical protein